MKNVVINKLEKYIFTEDQLKAHIKKHDKDLSYNTMTNQQIMFLAKKLLNEYSQSELEQHLMISPWRLPADWTGKMLDDDDSDPSMYIELVDTDLIGDSRGETVIDRLVSLTCISCDFRFFVEVGSIDYSNLKCPICAKALEGNQVEKMNLIRKNV
jgi:hypothetical protein